MKRLSFLVLVMFVLSTVAAGANQFSDVPFSHWAYDAINKLTAKGILQGYPDGTYKGEKIVTRYALAMVVAKMLANVEQMMQKGFGKDLVTKSDLQTLEKLTVEFADELALLGVKVTALEDDMQVVKEDVATLKKDVEGVKDYMAKGGLENVKLSGDMVIRHSTLLHNHDWSSAPGLGGGANNAQTQSQLRFQFKANIDENITAVARWHMLDKGDLMVPNSSQGRAGIGQVGFVYGTNGVGNGVRNNGDASTNIDLAYLNIRDMFRFGGDFTFGRNFYSTGHALLLNDYVDALRYSKRSGDIDITFMSIYDTHTGNYKDTFGGAAANSDYRNIWSVGFGTRYRDNDLYLNIFAQDEPNIMQRRFTPNTAPFAFFGIPSTFRSGAATTINLGKANSAAGAFIQSKDSMMDVEFGGKDPLGKNGHWDYDLGLAYVGYNAQIVPGITAGTNNYSDVEMAGWVGHGAVKWDSKKEWAARLGYTFANDENVGGLSLDNDRRYDDGIETPYEDISRGNTYFRSGLMNMYDMKLQVEYRPRNTKHYFRLAGDLLDEVKDTVSNDMARLAYGNHLPGVADTGGSVTSAANNIVAGSKVNTMYDKWNNFGASDPKSTVITFEYRYQLTENTRIRIGYTSFDMNGDFTKVNGAGTTSTSVGKGAGNGWDWDYYTTWAEIYSRF